MTGLLQKESDKDEFLSPRSFDSARTIMWKNYEGDLIEEKPRRDCRRHIYFTIPGFVFFIGLGILMLNYITGNQETNTAAWKHCGNSPIEASENDCVYDFIAGAFVPRACFDAELEEEFLNLKDWRFYGDSNGEQEISIDAIKRDGGSEPLFVSVEYHWVHCTYTWRKLHRSRMLGTPIDDHIADYEHTAHCGKGLVSQCDANDTRPIIAFLHHYTTCVP